MTLEAKLGAILSANAEISSLVGSRIYAETARQRDPQPYIVLKMLGSPPMHLQEGNPLPTRRWVYQISAIAPTFDGAVYLRALIEHTLVTFTDRPAPGVQRILQVAKGSIFLEAERNFQQSVDVDIIENLAA